MKHRMHVLTLGGCDVWVAETQAGELVYELKTLGTTITLTAEDVQLVAAIAQQVSHGDRIGVPSD